ncbi:MAG: N-acetyltransferase [Methylobacteriaceae bacterium]|nr:N-acetyltransferase [Methylobacteriaceae bacterium]
MSLAEIKITIRRSIADIPAAQWDACANPARAGELPPTGDGLYQGERYYPFLSHAFLHALEASGSVGARAGWMPSHLAVEDERERIVAVAPCYLKSHSQGEYVFDHAWADAYERAGGDYYPKLQVSVPFTPVNGRRLLVADEDDMTSREALIAGLRALRQQTGASSVHVTFPTAQEWEALGDVGFLQRTGQQFHFFNSGYGNFGEFLSDLASRKRKAIRKEREAALRDGISVEWVSGRDITEAHWDAFFAFYMDTGSRKWGRPYLNRKFFSLVGETLADRILLVMAKRAGRYIAGALNFIGDDALYGRNWGAIEEHPLLHFEVCYYQAIEFGITRGLKRVEAGAQGEHKLARGYRPVTTYSAHDFADPRMTRAIGDYLKNERRHIEAAIDIYGEHVPFRKVPEAQCR